MDLVQGAIGTEGSYDLALVGASVNVKVSYAIPVGKAALELDLDAIHVLDLIAKAIPGTVDDQIIAVMKAALAALGSK